MYDLKQTNVDECGAQTLDKSTGSFFFTGNIIVLKGCFPLGGWGLPRGSFSSPADAAATQMHILGSSTSLCLMRTLFRLAGSSRGFSKKRMSATGMSPSSFPSGVSLLLRYILMADRRSGFNTCTSAKARMG